MTRRLPSPVFPMSLAWQWHEAIADGAACGQAAARPSVAGLARAAWRACLQSTGFGRHGLSCGARGAALIAVVGLALAVLLGPDATRAWSSERMVQAAQRHGPLAIDGATALRELVRTIAGRPEAARVAAVNDFYNRRIIFMDDLEVWSAADHWTSPLELLGKGRGDCEDYAIAKYFSLLASGVPVHRMRLIYVRAQVGGPHGQIMPHLVLAYYATPSSDPLVLDNLIPDLRPASQRPDLTPVLSFNSQGLWDGVHGASAGDPLQRLSKWREVVAKARAEGFD